jgi:hypothetical protein
MSTTISTNISKVVYKILVQAVAINDKKWVLNYMKLVSYVRDKSQKAITDGIFSKKVTALRTSGKITADDNTVTSMAAEIVESHSEQVWDTLSYKYGASIVS